MVSRRDSVPSTAHSFSVFRKGNSGGGGEGVVGVDNPVGGETVADEFFAFVFAVTDDVHAQLVEEFGDFGVGCRVQTVRVVDDFGFRRNDFGGKGAGWNDARHLAVDDVGLFAAQHPGVGKGAFEVAGKPAPVKINRLPTDARCLRLSDKRPVRRSKDDVVPAPFEQPPEADGGGFRAAQACHRCGQNDFHNGKPCFFK